MSPKTIVIATVNAGKCTDAEIHAALKSRISGKAAADLLAKMVRDGLLIRKHGKRYGVSPKGARLLPSVQAPFRSGAYIVPVSAPRRPGAMDFAAAPSVAGGVRHAWRHPV